MESGGVLKNHFAFDWGFNLNFIAFEWFGSIHFTLWLFCFPIYPTIQFQRPFNVSISKMFKNKSAQRVFYTTTTLLYFFLVTLSSSKFRISLFPRKNSYLYYPNVYVCIACSYLSLQWCFEKFLFHYTTTIYTTTRK